ncbi:flavin monoamine oxidase family protein [Geobacillus sp. FSL W8-0032]|uniref:Flavin-dependent L-tryptophan oxidase RebO n=1 Tax=Geobacillus icigianus TaxID=1430331 RepID=A0ABU6BJM0_9BACL|nr:flavin monoamine oxidase family protein [Geobacillus icigianus]MEB3751903.1 Flavin-dependent L-tryptophan oxidase RebO [Geobacillus icigianus]
MAHPYVSPRLPMETMISIIRNGLKKPSAPKTVVIIGAGMAGLVAASLLKQAGHRITILEASERVGGRIYTLRSDFRDGQYLEAGAMRIPHTHPLTLAYIKKFNLPLHPFINSTPRDIFYFRGVKARLNEYERHPDLFGFPVAPHERGKTASELLQMAIRPVIQFIEQHPEQHWPIVIERLDRYSLDAYLRYNPFGPRLSVGAIDMIKTVLSLEGFPELSFLEVLRELMVLFTPNIRFYEIAGGNDQLPKAFLPQLKDEILFSHKVQKIVQTPNSVTVHATHTKIFQPFQITADRVIVTIPFSVLQFVDIEPRHSFSENKWKAIRELHYAGSTKTGIQFKTRFWEKEGMFGGKTVSDLPIRYTQYPSQGIGTLGPGVVLASYTWEDDTIPWDSLSDEERLEYTLKNLAVIHGEQVYREFETGTSHSWVRDPYSGGAFTMMKPNQVTELSPYIALPEGRIHFAGEHASTHHGWIQGAIESGICAAYEVNEAPA